MTETKLLRNDEARWSALSTPFGEIVLVGGERALHHLLLPNTASRLGAALEEKRRGTPASVVEAATQLSEYFAGERLSFDVPLEPAGSQFQVEVWLALAGIPYATTVSYGELAARLGRPSASRAVGMANGRNPLPIVLPCHRVIGSSGRLVGYGGGLPLKEALLAHERKVFEQRLATGAASPAAARA